MMSLARLYTWELETKDGFILKQFDEKGDPHSTMELPAEDIIRVSLIPLFPTMNKHDCIIDLANGERFIKKFRKHFMKKTQTNLDWKLGVWDITRESTIEHMLNKYGTSPATQSMELFSNIFWVKEGSRFWEPVLKIVGGTEVLFSQTLTDLRLTVQSTVGELLNKLNLPKNENKHLFVDCIVTNRYRFWMFMDGRTMTTKNDYEVFL